jgi:hypothetical protein
MDEQQTQMFKQLNNIQQEIDLQKKILEEKLEHRKTVVRFCYNDKKISAIKIAEALNMTRQRVYVLIEDKEEEE